MAKRSRKKTAAGIGIILGLIVLSVVGQFVFNLSISPIPQRPSETFDWGGAERLIYYFYLEQNGLPLPEDVELTEDFINQELEGSFRYVNSRYDTSDFRMNSLVRLYLGHRDRLPESTLEDIKGVMLNFKYWMDQGGEDSMCYWSENHQILFATQEYLVGQTFPDEIFTVDGKTGREHREMARRRIETWMEQRFYYGFVEWYSSNYYPHNVGPMANFIQFAEDPAMVTRMQMIMDLLWYDIASQSFRYEGTGRKADLSSDLSSDLPSDSGTDPETVETIEVPRTYYVFVSSSGRSYSDNRVNDDIGNQMRNFIDFAVQPELTRDLENSWSSSRSGTFNSFRQLMEARRPDGSPYYTIPPVILEIFNNPAPEKIVTSSQSLDLEELVSMGLVGQDDPQIMMQFAMEAFTHPLVVDNTITYLSRNKMFRNDFLNDFKLVNLWPIRAFGLLGKVSELLNPAPNGVAIQRANVYTYITPNFSIHNAQAYHPGDYADQHGISSVNVTNTVSLFTTQPAKIPRRGSTPSYWTGNGRNPYSVQEKNVLLEIYNPPAKPGFMEPMVVPETTHAYFPVQFFDEVVPTHLAEGKIFGRIGNTYVGILTRHPLGFVPFEISSQEDNKDNMLVRGNVKNILTGDYDLVQSGPGKHYFVTELSSSQVESFEEFQKRIITNPLDFDPQTHTLVYRTLLNNEPIPRELKAVYNQGFFIDGNPVNLEYQRFESPYVPGNLGQRYADEIVFNFQGQTLILDYPQTLREFTTRVSERPGSPSGITDPEGL